MSVATPVRSDTALVSVLSEISRIAAETLDLHDVFQHISGAAGRVLEFDAMTVTLNADDGGFVLYTIAGPSLSEDDRRAYARRVPRAEYSPGFWTVLTRAGRTDDLHQVLDESFARDRNLKATGIRSMLRAPLHGAAGSGYLSILSLRPGAYGPEDEAFLRPIADLVAMVFEHDRLYHAERERRRRNEILEELVPTLAKALDVREVFDQVSAIVQKAIPHDRLAIGLLNEDRSAVRIRALTGGVLAGMSDTIRLGKEDMDRREGDFEIVRDARAELDPSSDKCRLLTGDGVRSLLRVPIVFEGQWQFAGGLVFMSRTAGQYGEEDVPLARRVADQVALALSHQRLAEEARRTTEARAEAAKLEEKVAHLTEELASRDGFSRIVGESRSWRDVLVQATKVAATSTTVLLTGESGTGKEIVARAIHRASPRATGPFVALNCAALPDQLLESELFGYEKGAFTGAAAAKPGRLELAAGGVLFLDETGEMSPAVQAKLLRVLQEREFQRLGGTKVLKADVRVISATNRDLKQAIAKGEFREDLYYRLGVFEIRLPPLRERPEDILPLTESFLAEFGPAIGRPVAGISREAKDLLLGYPWPGNVRELKNALERAAILCEGGLITAAHLPISVSRGDSGASLPVVKAPTAGGFPPGGVDLEAVERGYVREALRHARGNKSKAAKLLGLTRAQLYSRIEKYGLEGDPGGD